jgi:hypothetical protein
MTGRRRILAMHRGDDHHDGHRPTSAFDFYCVAHGSDYSPKYLLGGVCHDSLDEGFCHPDCRICPRECPVVPCPDEAAR